MVSPAMWLVAFAWAETVVEAFPPPEGAVRAPADPFGVYLRTLPLRPPGTPVLDHRGREVAMPAARVVDLPLVPGDLQQCADSAIRLRATWERATGAAPAFHYTSGDLSTWDGWAAGDRLVVRGSTVTRARGAATPDAGDASFERWLASVFTYAGTWSLLKDTAADDRVDPGDLLLAPGSPGHAVVVLDVARRGADTWVLVGQGYMPAMDFHVVAGPDGGWFPVAGEVLPTAPIAMPWSGLRRWVSPRGG